MMSARPISLSSTSKKKSKKVKDNNAPKSAVTAFIHFSNERREDIRSRNPEVSFAELSKLISNEWGALTPEAKKIYFDAAQRDRERYQRELEEYQQSDAYRLFEQQQRQQLKTSSAAGLLMMPPSSSGGILGGKLQTEMAASTSSQIHSAPSSKSTFSIPIFTDEFLEHNKGREQELRQLRKNVIEYEEQNAVLSKHIDRMKLEIERVQGDYIQSHQHLLVTQEHLSAIRSRLAQYFANLPLPGHEAATVINIDSYMKHLQTLCVEQKAHHEVPIKLARDRLNKLLLECPQLFM